MLPGLTLLRACPDCGAAVLQYTLRSGNTFGARFWTDGWMEAPMLPDRPGLVKCSRCSGLFWIDEARQMAQVDPMEPSRRKSNKFDDAIEPIDPTFEEICAFIASSGLSGEKERYARLRAWRTANHKRRKTRKPPAPLSQAEKDNLLALSSMSGDDEVEQTIMNAEIARELGDFQECLRLLDRPFDEQWQKAVRTIRRLARAGVWSVKEMKLSDD
jgi:hypothetical protein